METNILPEINILFIRAQAKHIMSCMFGLGSFLLTRLDTELSNQGLRAKVDQKVVYSIVPYFRGMEKIIN